jgi:hypothetical protein
MYLNTQRTLHSGPIDVGHRSFIGFATFQADEQGQSDGSSVSATARAATVRFEPDQRLGNALVKDLIQPSQPPEPQLETQQQLKLMMMPASGKIKHCMRFVSNFAKIVKSGKFFS